MQDNFYHQYHFSAVTDYFEGLNAKAGEVVLYTEQFPCTSCQAEIESFRELSPNIEFVINYGQNGTMMDLETYQLDHNETIIDYYTNIDKRQWTPQASIACAFDDSAQEIATNPIRFIAVVIPLSIISLRQGFLPDYLNVILSKIRNISELLSPDDRVCYRDDLATLDSLMTHAPYSIIETKSSFMENADSLIPPSALK
jgi:hypothetical protein